MSELGFLGLKDFRDWAKAPDRMDLLPLAKANSKG
jgi:hypothetical protein